MVKGSHFRALLSTAFPKLQILNVSFLDLEMDAEDFLQEVNWPQFKRLYFWKILPQKWPQRIEQLTTLEELVADDCGDLEALPDWLGTLHSLRVMRFKYRSKLGILKSETARPDAFPLSAWLTSYLIHYTFKIHRKAIIPSIKSHTKRRACHPLKEEERKKERKPLSTPHPPSGGHRPNYLWLAQLSKRSENRITANS